MRLIIIYLQKCIDHLFEDGYVANIAIRYGTINDFQDFFRGTQNEITENTNFDMASVTKILSIATLCLIALDEGKIALDNLVSKYFSCPEDKKELTVNHLLLHGIGFGYKPLYSMDVNSDNVVDTILGFPSEFPVGTRVMYSCSAYILLGKILEKIYGKTLDVLFDEKVAKPLEMQDTGFGKRKGKVINANDTDELLGIVNDRNSRIIGGVAGNAGIFSNLKDMTKYAKMLVNFGDPIIKRDTFADAIKIHTPPIGEKRGLGFLYVSETYKQTGELFPVGSFGHCGHTGQSIFVNPNTGFFAIILSDMTLKTKGVYSKVTEAREAIHNAIKADIDYSK